MNGTISSQYNIQNRQNTSASYKKNVYAISKSSGR